MTEFWEANFIDRQEVWDFLALVMKEMTINTCRIHPLRLSHLHPIERSLLARFVL